MFVKVHSSYRQIVAICDSDILGKKFEEGIKLLDVRENFYKGEEVSDDKIIELMIDYAKEDATFNIAGNKSVASAIKAGIISKEGVEKVAGISYALILM